jgi:hypothetical protein
MLTSNAQALRIFNYNNNTHKTKATNKLKRQGETHITFEFVGNLNFTPNLIAMYFLLKISLRFMTKLWSQCCVFFTL